MSGPTISAVVTAYNAEDYIAGSLTAILAQTHAPDEVVVVDDGSTDGTRDVLSTFGREIRIVRQPNGGHPAALNRGFREARGDYVAKCDADDIWEPNKLERQFKAVLQHPSVDFAFCATRLFGGAEGPFGADPGEGLLDAREFARLLYRSNLVCASSMMIRRSIYGQLGPFRERFWAEDYDYWLRALEVRAVFHYDRRPLVRYRTHDQQITHNVLRTHESRYKVHRWHAELLDDSSLVRSVLSHDLYAIARIHVNRRCHGEARAAFLNSLRHKPSLRAVVWAAALSVPERYRVIDPSRLVRMTRALTRPDLRRDRA